MTATNKRLLTSESRGDLNRCTKATYLRYRFWRLPIKYFLNLAWVNCNSLSRDDMSKKRNFLQPESTITEFSIELMVLKLLQNNTEISRMLFFTLEIDQDVINEDHDKVV
jgi:hypothetical protein